MSTLLTTPAVQEVHQGKPSSDSAAFECRKSHLLRLWICTGLFFMVLPGTILGFTNLLAISAHHGFTGLSPAWIQAHGHSQIFGWIGSFVLGIGFYSQPRTRVNSGRLPIVCWMLWTGGLILHWLASAYLWHWRLTLPVSGAFEFAAIVLFQYSARQHKQPAAACAGPARKPARKPGIEPWMRAVLISSIALFLAIAINLVTSVQLALHGASPAISHVFDQRYLVLLGWGFLAPMIWGFSARWLPSFLGVAPAHRRLLQIAIGLDLLGVVLGMALQMVWMAGVLTAGAVLAAIAIRVFAQAKHPAKSIGLHRSFPFFLRVAYAWSLAAALLGIWASLADVHGGIWGGSRHALTVGFAAMMVMTVGPRILPHFAGVPGIWSRGLMFATLLLLFAGCTLRVSMEPLAYEGIAAFAWKLLPFSGCLELGAVLLFALQLILTFTLEPQLLAVVEDRVGSVA